MLFCGENRGVKLEAFEAIRKKSQYVNIYNMHYAIIIFYGVRFHSSPRIFYVKNLIKPIIYSFFRTIVNSLLRNNFFLIIYSFGEVLLRLDL